MDPVENKEPEETPLKQIRTYQGDVADALEKQHESLVSIQQVERLRKESGQSTKASTDNIEKRKELIYLFLGSLFLIILSGVGGWYAYNEFVRKTSPPPASVPLNRFVFADSEIGLNVSGNSREALIKTLLGTISGVPPGEIKHVVLNKTVGEEEQLLSSEEFLSMLGSQAPGNLIRALDPLFMFGAFGESTFLIIKLVSFENAYAGMLAWEKNLGRDIGPLFTTARFIINAPPESTFSDLRDNNKDLRVFIPDDLSILLYSFLDNNMLIITDNIVTMRAIIERLTQEKLSR